jgi:hypothetical protein
MVFQLRENESVVQREQDRLFSLFMPAVSLGVGIVLS